MKYVKIPKLYKLKNENKPSIGVQCKNSTKQAGAELGQAQPQLC